jgi:hypothetical protein
MGFNPEPSHRHGNVSRTAVVLANLGTPDAPTAAAVKVYLKQFLSDPRVVEIAFSFQTVSRKICVYLDGAGIAVEGAHRTPGGAAAIGAECSRA